MGILPLLYWIILILSLLGVFAPESWAAHRWRLAGGAWVVLFIIIGLRVFRIPIA